MKSIKLQTDALQTAGALGASQQSYQVKKGDDVRKTQLGRGGKDEVRLEKTGADRGSVEQAFQKILEQLKRQYPKIQIVVEQPVSGETSDILSRVLDKMGEGAVVVLSDEFMAGLHAGKESYERKTKALIECMRKLADMGTSSGVWLEEDQAVFWKKNDENPFKWKGNNNQDAQFLSQLPSPAEAEVKKFRLSATSSYHIAWAYSLLARAKTRPMVQNAMQEARRSIASLKLITAFGSEEEQMKARAAIRSLQKLILRGNRKLRRFTEEALTETRRKRAVERRQEEKALKEELELRRQRKSRAIGDGAIYKEGQLESLNMPEYYKSHPGRKKRYDVRYDAEAALTVPAMPPPLPGGGMIEAQGPAENYTVTEVMTF